MNLGETKHHLACRPGAWGAGFLLRDPASMAGFIVFTFEHVTDAEGRPVERRRITHEAAAHGIGPCFDRSRTPRAEFCFELTPGGVIHPHDNHPEWSRPDATWVQTLLQSVGLRRSGVDN